MNALGQLVSACWQRSPFHFSHLALDAFVIMPNHIHGILMLTDSGRGAALEQGPAQLTNNIHPNATPGSNAASNINAPEPGVAFGQGMVDQIDKQLPNATPLRPRLIAGSVGAIVLNFKSVTNRTRNRIQRSPGAVLWQRNYYEHVIRDASSLEHLRQYIHNNPLSWQEDQLHPDVPSNW